MSQECLEVIGNTEVIALADSTRARLVSQAPEPAWPNASQLPPAPGHTRHQKYTSSVVNITMQVWAKILQDGSVGVVALNRGIVQMPVTIPWWLIGLATSKTCEVRDL